MMPPVLREEHWYRIDGDVAELTITVLEGEVVAMTEGALATLKGEYATDEGEDQYLVNAAWVDQQMRRLGFDRL